MIEPRTFCLVGMVRFMQVDSLSGRVKHKRDRAMTERKDNELSKQSHGLNITGKMRRVLLAEQPDGGSFVAREDEIEPATFPGIGQLYTLWGTDAVIELPDCGNVPVFEGTFPPVGGFRIFLTRFAPSEDALSGGGDMPDNLKNIPSASDMHSSATVDCNLLLSGTLDCMLSDGSVVTLQAGEMIVLNGAEHAWQNNSSNEATMLFFMTGASRE